MTWDSTSEVLLCFHQTTDSSLLLIFFPRLFAFPTAGSVNFTLLYPGDDPLPTNASLEIFFGDGSTERHEIPQSMSQMKDGQLEFEHEFQKAGKYKTMFTLSNLVSRLTLKMQSFVLKRIHGLSLQVNMKGREESDGFGLNSDRFPTSKLIEFKLNVEDGDVERFVIQRNGQMFKETTQDRVQFSSQEVRKYFHSLSSSIRFPFPFCTNTHSLVHT